MDRLLVDASARAGRRALLRQAAAAARLPAWAARHACSACGGGRAAILGQRLARQNQRNFRCDGSASGSARRLGSASGFGVSAAVGAATGAAAGPTSAYFDSGNPRPRLRRRRERRPRRSRSSPRSSGGRSDARLGAPPCACLRGSAGAALRRRPELRRRRTLKLRRPRAPAGTHGGTRSPVTIPIAVAVPLTAILTRRPFVAGHAIDVFVLFFQEVRYVQERIALQAQIDEGRLHARQHARHAALVDTPGERIFIGPLEVNLHQLIVFQERHSGFVPIGRNHQFLAHPQPPSRGFDAGCYSDPAKGGTVLRRFGVCGRLVTRKWSSNSNTPDSTSPNEASELPGRPQKSSTETRLPSPRPYYTQVGLPNSTSTTSRTTPRAKRHRCALNSKTAGAGHCSPAPAS